MASDSASPRVAMADIIALVGRESGVSGAEIVGRGRSARVAEVRQVCYLLGREQGYSLPRISRAVGGRDHTTIMKGLEAVERRMAADPALAAMVAHVRVRVAAQSAPLARIGQLRGALVRRVQVARLDELERVALALGVQP